MDRLEDPSKGSNTSNKDKTFNNSGQIFCTGTPVSQVCAQLGKAGPGGNIGPLVPRFGRTIQFPWLPAAPSDARQAVVFWLSSCEDVTSRREFVCYNQCDSASEKKIN